jgi:hypothetical protein
MKKKRGIQINFFNRWLYTLIALGILVIISVGVYALQAGVKPNPGHDLSELGVPSGCTSGQVISWNGTALVCSYVSQGLYGFCRLGRPCEVYYPPAICGMSGCSCPAGYTLVSLDYVSPSQVFSCYKN